MIEAAGPGVAEWGRRALTFTRRRFLLLLAAVAPGVVSAGFLWPRDAVSSGPGSTPDPGTGGPARRGHRARVGLRHRHDGLHRLRPVRRGVQGGERRPGRTPSTTGPGSSATASTADGTVYVDSPDGGIDGFPPTSTAARRGRAWSRQQLVRAPAVHAVREPAVHDGLPGGRDLPDAGRRRPGRPAALHRLRLLRRGLPVRRPLPRPGRRALAERHPRRRRQVHLVLPPHQPRPAAGLRGGLPGRRAHVRRPERPGQRDQRRRREQPGACSSAPELGTKPRVFYLGLESEVGLIDAADPGAARARRSAIAPATPSCGVRAAVRARSAVACRARCGAGSPFLLALLAVFGAVARALTLPPGWRGLRHHARRSSGDC